MFAVTERLPPHPRGSLHQRHHRGRGGPHQRRERHLSRDAVIEAALRVVDSEGVDAVTMRRVGQELGTGAASLYAHVQDKDELLAGVFDHVLADEDFAVTPDPQRWEEQVKDVVRKVHAILLRHNDLAKVALGTVPTGPNAVRGMESLMAVLHAAGMPPRTIGYAGDLLGQFLSVSAYEESLFRTRMQSPTDRAEFHRELLAFFDGLPAGSFPTMKALAPHLTDPDEPDDARFEFGLDTLVRGLASHLPTGRATGRSARA